MNHSSGWVKRQASVIRVVDAVGTPRTPADFVQEARIQASVTDPVSGRTHELDVSGPEPDGTYVATWPVPSDIEAATVNVSLRLEVIAQTGIALQPRLRNYAVSVQPPVTYPSLGPAQLRLSNISDRTGEAIGTILVTGRRRERRLRLVRGGERAAGAAERR
jgi:hypothetical protein